MLSLWDLEKLKHYSNDSSELISSLYTISFWGIMNLGQFITLAE
jgi:hypothetical protein